MQAALATFLVRALLGMLGAESLCPFTEGRHDLCVAFPTMSRLLRGEVKSTRASWLLHGNASPSDLLFVVRFQTLPGLVDPETGAVMWCPPYEVYVIPTREAPMKLEFDDLAGRLMRWRVAVSGNFTPLAEWKALQVLEKHSGQLRAA